MEVHPFEIGNIELKCFKVNYPDELYDLVAISTSHFLQFF